MIRRHVKLEFQRAGKLPVLKGTTTIGVVCHDGVVLTTDTRATMGSFVAHKHAKKVYRIDQHIAMTIAGVVGDAQAIVEMLRANSALYKLDLARPIPILSDGGSGAHRRNGRFRRSHFHVGPAWKHDGRKIRLHRLRISSRIRSAGIGMERYDEC